MLMGVESIPKLNPLINLSQLTQGFRYFNTFCYDKKKFNSE